MVRWNRARSVLILGGLALLASPSPAPACQTPAQPGLWDATHEAELIVVGKIVDVEVNEMALAFDRASMGATDLLYVLGARVPLPTIDPLAAVTIEVDETLVGAHGSRVITRLEGVTSENTTHLSFSAIFFLHGEGGVWRWTRYPIDYASPQELTDLRWLIARAKALGPRAMDEEKLDWLVESVVRTATRRNAVWELKRYEPLPEHVLRRLAEGFVADPGTGWALPELLELLAPYPSTEVDRAALAGLRALPRGLACDEAVALVKARVGDSAAAGLAGGK